MSAVTETAHGHAPTEGAGVRMKGMDPALMGIMLFIGSEIMFFAALFGSYFNVKATTRPFPQEGTEFIGWQGDLPFGLGLSVLITIVLVISSFTMQWATMRIRVGDRKGMTFGIGITLLLGIFFLCLQAYEYAHLIFDENFTIGSSTYGTLFFTMTGFHGAHVIGGVIGLAVIFFRGLQGQFSAEHHSAVEAVHYYWHFVDIVWIALFATIYVLR
jgi:cytochrome c oxidase subunit 3